MHDMNNLVLPRRKIAPPCFALVFFLLALGLAGCTGKEPPLSPGAAAFKKDVQGVIGRLTPALGGPLAHNDAEAAKTAILSLYPTAGQVKDDFPFWVGAMTKDGILLTGLPPGPVIGKDFSNYQLVQETLDKRRINKMRLYGPDGTPIYVVLAPVMVQDNCVGLVGLRLTAAQALKKWGITEPEFQAMDLN
jgi:hypothetical protein